MQNSNQLLHFFLDNKTEIITASESIVQKTLPERYVNFNAYSPFEDVYEIYLTTVPDQKEDSFAYIRLRFLKCGVARIERVYVEPLFRRCGLGTLLLLFVERGCICVGIKKIELFFSPYSRVDTSEFEKIAQSLLISNPRDENGEFYLANGYYYVPGDIRKMEKQLI